MPKAPTRSVPPAITCLFYLFCIVLVLVPFHGFFTTWLGSEFGGLLIWRAWKEMLLLPMFLLGLFYFIKDASLRRSIWNHTVNKVILAYALLQVFLVLFGNVDPDATVLGLLINLRFLIFFVLAQIIVFYRPVPDAVIAKLLFYPAVGVVVFGLLQLFALPKDFLSHFGYDKYQTIPPYFTIDNQEDKIRIASTLRGPNSLGAYLLLPLVGALSFVWERAKQWWIYAVGAIAGLVVLYASHSRSAWIGFLVSLATFIFLKATPKVRLAFVTIGCIGLLAGLGAVYQFRDTYFVQDTILHDNAEVGSEISSNKGHIEATLSGLRDVGERPLQGCAPGCAGPASVHNEAGANISENYYVQIGQEVGVLGILLFLSIIGLTAWQLWQQKGDPFALVLLATLVGLSVTNLLLHTWADDTLAYVWWGIAGLVMWRRSRVGSETATATHLRTSE